MKIRIAIADDHPLVINGLKHIIANTPDMEVISSFANGSELLSGMAQQVPDILLLDIQMPGQTGDELAAVISEKYPSLLMIALTNQDNVFYAKTMLRKGVKGYLLKTTSDDILLDAIRTVLAGGLYIDPEMKEKLLQESLNIKKESTANPLLSRREKEILKFIVQDLTSQEIAERLSISKRTVDQHRASLLLKLDVKHATALVKKAIQLGLHE